MRRIASVFSKRDKKSEAGGSTKDKSLRRNQTLTLGRLSTPSIPALIASHHSSTSSASIKTPDIDDDHPGISRSSSGFWKKLTRKTSTFKAPKIAIPTPSVDEQDLDPDDDYGDPEPSHAALPLVEQPSAKVALLQLTRNKLVSSASPSVPPLVHHANSSSPVFPSSCSSHTSYHSRGSLTARMLHSRLLRHLQGPLSPADEVLLASFPSQPNTSPSAPVDPDSPDNINSIDSAVPKGLTVSLHCESLKRWISRPCFEERFVSYVPTDDGVVAHRVGATFAIASLEYSEHLCNLAAVYDEPILSPDSLSVTSSASLSTPPSSATTVTAFTQVPRMPSPLSQEHDSSSSEASSPAPPLQEDYLATKSVVGDPAATVRRGVRFAEDGKDDIPLGYAVRRRRQQEAKAKFLREQKERRTFEVEQARIAEERRRRDQERAAWEKERHAWEQEKRAIEEERRQRQYASSFAAARQRQEASRTSSSDSPKYLTPSGSYTSLHETDARHARRHSARSQSSYSPGSSPREASSSRPASLIIPPEGSQGHSRPSSLHSSSSDDSKVRDSQSRRFSTIGHSRPASERSSTYPTLSQQAFIPPVPSIPNYLEMPLMPPTPPFVLQQYSRRRQSSSPSPRPSSQNSSRSDQYARSPSSSSQRRDTSSSPHRPMAGHQRRPSGDAPQARHPAGERGRADSSRSSGRRSSTLVNPAQNSTQYGAVSVRPPNHTDSSPRPLPSRRRTALS